ncbi:MAG: alkaline phosphatase family protein [Bacteroidetes bacterium]|nr:alkaline phosphatase family protein [Bacteroidota bacterium]
MSTIENPSSVIRKTLTSRSIILAFFLLFVQVALYASQSRKVLIIGIDGCRSDALQQANAPHIDSLANAGLYSYDSWHLGITISGPSWSTIMTGTWWNKHGVKGNSYANSNFNSYPYFTKRAKELKPNLHCVQIAEWGPLSTEVYNDGMDLKIQTDDGGDSTTAEALRQLNDSNLDCLFAYYEAVDRAGHATGFSPNNSNYISSIEYVDDQVGILMNKLKTRPHYAHEDWLVLLVTDHGGTGILHGGNSWSERHVWWIASGSAVESAQIIKGDPGTYNFLGTGIFNSLGVNKTLMKQSPVLADIAVTALHHLIYDTGINPETYTAWQLDGKSWLANTIGMEELTEQNHINIYPNPSGGEINLIVENPLGESVQVQVYDLSGRCVKQMEASKGSNKLKLDLSDLTNGTYLSKVSIGKQSTTKRITLLR